MKGKITKEELDKSLITQLESISIDVQSLGFIQGLEADKISNTQLIQSLIDNHNDLVLYFPSGINKLGHLNLGTDKNITFRGKSSAFATSVNKSVSNPRIIDTYTRILVDDENEYWLEHDNCTIIFDKISILNCEIDTDNTITPLKKMAMIKTNANPTKGKIFATESSFIGWKILSGDRDILTKDEDLLHSCWLASRCRFTENEVALSQLVDSRIIDCSFNKNDYGIVLKDKAGFSTIANNRLEWNRKNGIRIHKTHEVIIHNNEFDRNSLAGCYIDGMINGSLTGNVFRRNGALDGLEKNNYEENVHYVIKNCNNMKVKDNITRAMSILDTPTGGKTKPSNVCKVVDNDHLIFKDNDILGCTRTNKLEGCEIQNNINSVIDNLSDFSSTNKNKLPEIHFMNNSPDEDATLIKCSNGITVLIDCGNESTGNILCDKINKLGVTKLDYLFITHSHSDHIGGAVTVIERLKPSVLYYKDITWELPSIETSRKTLEYHRKMENKAKELDIKLVKLTQLTNLNITEKEYFTFYNCGIYNDKSDYNMNSLMIGYDYLGTKVLIQSDCYTVVAYNKYIREIGKVNLLKMVCHGKQENNVTKAWLEQIKPDYSFYSHEDTTNLEYYKATTFTKLYSTDYDMYNSGCFLITSSGVVPTSTVKENKIYNKITTINILNYNHLVEKANDIYNWTKAFNQAFSDLPDGGILVIPNGEYRMTRATLQNKKGITINCSGVIMPLDNTTPLIGTITMKNITNSIFNGLSFDGNKENVTITNKFGTQSLLNFDNSDNCIFNNIVFRNTCENAFNSNGNLNNIIFNNSNIYNIGEHGFYFGGTNVKNIRFNNLYVEDIGMSTVNQSRQCGAVKFRNKTNKDIMHDNISINGFEFTSSLTNVTGYQLLVLGYDTKNILIENGKIKGKRTCIFATNVTMDNIKINNVELDGKYLFYGYNKLNGYGEEGIEGKRNIEIDNSSLTCECKNYLEISRISNSKIKLSGNWDDAMSLSEGNNDILFENNDINMNSYRFSLTKLSNNLTNRKCNYSNMSKTSPLYEINNNNDIICNIKFEDITESQEHTIFFQTNTAFNLIFMNSTIKGIIKSTVALKSFTVFNCNLATAKLDKYITSQLWNINNVYDLLGVRYDYGIKSATCLSYNINVNLDLRYVIAKSLTNGNLLITNDKGVPFTYTLDGDIVRLSLVEQDRSSDTVFKVIYSI